MRQLNEIIEACAHDAFDLNFTKAKAWKEKDKSRVLVGYMPIYFPREIVHAVGGLAVGIQGGGDRKQIVKGDAYYQSYICHIPRGIIELALDHHFDEFEAFIFPSICDVIRNLSGIFKTLGVGTFVKYMDFPQNFLPHIGGVFYQKEMQHVIDGISKLSGVELTKEKLNHSISLYNKNRQMINEIYAIRQTAPWRLSIADVYHIVRAGMVMPVEDHNDILAEVLIHIKKDIGSPMDKIRVVVSGAFCEQPPIGLIRSLEQAGCYVIEDDFLQGSRWIEGDVDPTTDDPLRALSDAYLTKSTYSSSVYDVDHPKEERLAKQVRECKADGVVFAGPSFCDPALLDAPNYMTGCEKENIRYISIQYSENTGQFKVIKEQVGTFSDSIKLWEDEPVTVNK